MQDSSTCTGSVPLQGLAVAARWNEEGSKMNSEVGRKNELLSIPNFPWIQVGVVTQKLSPSR